MEQRTMIVSSTEKPNKIFNDNSSKNKMDDTLCDEKDLCDEEYHDVINNSSELAITSFNHNELNKHHDDRINFVAMCRQKFDKSELPVDFDQRTVEEQHDYLMNNVDKYFSNIPASLRFVLPAIFKDGDCGRSMSERPDWLDMNKFRRGQMFAQKYFAGICFSQLIGLFYIFSIQDGLKILILSRKSDTVYRAFKRYLSTIVRLKNWYLEDPWNQETQAYRNIQEVRKMHLAMRQRLCSYDYKQIDAISRISNIYSPMQNMIVEDFEESYPEARDLQCPFTMTRTKSINQGDMSCMQCGFMGLIVLHPEKFGVHNVCDEDLEAFCHMWRGLGYLLGIEDSYNFCRGSLQEIRGRVKDVVESWIKPNLRSVTSEWEHMSICLYNGIGYILPLMNYKIYLLYFCDILKLNMPRLYWSMNLVEKTIYMLLNFHFDYLMRLPIVNAFFNTMLCRRLNLAELLYLNNNERKKI